MIQMLATLSGIQQAKQAQDLAERQFQESTKQAAAQLGFQKDSAEYKKVSDILTEIGKTSVGSRKSLVDLGRAVGLSDAEVNALTQYGQNAPESLSTLQAKAATQGYADATPQARAGMNAEAASTATSGMNQGQAAISGVTQNLATGGTAPIANMKADTIAKLAQSYLERFAGGEMGIGYAASRAAGDSPALVKKLAGIQAGGMTDAQQAGASAQVTQGQAALGNVQADFYRTNANMIYQAGDLAAKIASSKAMMGGFVTPENRIQATNSMKAILDAMSKEKSSSAHDYYVAQYNNLADMIGAQKMTDTSPGGIAEQATMLEKLRGSLIPPGAPPPQTPQFNNSLAPFVSRPPQ